MILRGLLAAALVLGLTTAAQAAAFTVTSPAFTDNGPLPQSGADAKCGGQSISPPLAWTNVPAGVQSFALVLYDPDAPGGPGFNQWVTYGIPASASSIPAGFSTQAAGHVGGANGAGTQTFRGYVPPAGEAPHHYTFTVYATDLAPAALSSGLGREALLAAMHGHVKAAQSIVGRFGC